MPVSVERLRSGSDVPTVAVGVDAWPSGTVDLSDRVPTAPESSRVSAE
jgi:hypothetical protein